MASSSPPTSDAASESSESNLQTPQQSPAGSAGAYGWHPRFAAFAWGVTVYIFFIILFGAWVRISGSGAGCGEHWPMCNGEVVPVSPNQKTIIEYTHRVTSGLLGPMVIALWLWSWLGAGRRSVVRWLSGITLLFVVFEALIGAGLVLRGLVAENASLGRAFVVALHLGNTLILTSCCVATAWLGKGRALPALKRTYAGRRSFVWCLIGIVFVCMSGAITALGDTLFPAHVVSSGSVLEHLLAGLRPDVHFLVRLRVFHPLLALVVGVLTVNVLQRWDGRAGALGRFASGTALCLWLQIGLGLVNIMLSAPGWLQLVHLGVAECVWAGLSLTFIAAQAEA